MIIKKPTYIYKGISHETSAMRPKHTVDNVMGSEIILITNYDVVGEDFYKRFDEMLKLCLLENKEIYYDSTTELLSQEFLQRIKHYKDLSPINIFTNGIVDESIEDLKVVKSRGLNITVEPYFVKHYDYYVPIKNYNTQKKERRQFLLLGGKSKTFRTALTSLLYFEGLDKCGYISYFGFNPLETFTNETKDIYP